MARSRTSTEAPQTWLALLRGVNVGGKNKLAMKDLAALCVAEGCAEVRTYIQSGNVLFVAPPEVAAALPARLALALEKKHGVRSPVVLRSAARLAEIVGESPFLARGEAAEKLHVAFLDREPTEAQRAALDPARSPGDHFAVVRGEVHLFLPNGVGKTRLTNDYFDRALTAVSTVRNWRTVGALLALARGEEP